MYQITKYTYAIAEEYDVKVELSDKKNKKIKVTLKDGTLFHLGNNKMSDYASMLIKCEQGEMDINAANKRQEAFRKRFSKQMEVFNSGAYWVGKLLWLL